MKLLTIKHYLGGALMLAALVATPAILKASNANALPPELSEELNITPEQQAELDAIGADARTQAATILTEDQLAALEGKTGRERMQAMRSLDLTEEQRTQLREIGEESRAAAADVFTEEQQAQLEAMHGERGHRGNRAEGRNHHQPFAEALNITPEQQTELTAIQENAQTRVAAVLTDDQLAAIEGQTGRERMQTMRSFDLSEEQQAELRDIHESSRAAANEVLTEEQQAQLQEMRSKRGDRPAR